MSTNTFDSARDYADMGFVPLPLAPNSKIAILPNWTTLRPRTLLRRVRPSDNLGLRLGRQTDWTYLFAIDVDPRHDGDLQHLLQNRKFPSTAHAITPGGGDHYLLRSPYPVRTRIGLVQGVDLLGVGSLVAVEPSTIDGRSYLWLRAAVGRRSLPLLAPGRLAPRRPPGSPVLLAPPVGSKHAVAATGVSEGKKAAFPTTGAAGPARQPSCPLPRGTRPAELPTDSHDQGTGQSRAWRPRDYHSFTCLVGSLVSAASMQDRPRWVCGPSSVEIHSEDIAGAQRRARPLPFWIGGNGGAGRGGGQRTGRAGPLRADGTSVPVGPLDSFRPRVAALSPAGF